MTRELGDVLALLVKRSCQQRPIDDWGRCSMYVWMCWGRGDRDVLASRDALPEEILEFQMILRLRRRRVLIYHHAPSAPSGHLTAAVNTFFGGAAEHS